MMKKLLLIPLLAAGCIAENPPELGASLPYVRDYRAEGDACYLVGESPETVTFLDDSADLVVCPSDYEGIGLFIAETGAKQVETYIGFTLFSVPRG